jgi:hypothetical protein
MGTAQARRVDKAADKLVKAVVYMHGRPGRRDQASLSESQSGELVYAWGLDN